MVRRSNKKPEWQTRTAKERIQRLIFLALEKAKVDPNYSKKHVELAMKIGMRYNVRLPKEIKRRICKNCKSYLIPGENCTVRTNPKQQAVIAVCKNCCSVRRFPYRKEKAQGK